MKRTKRSIKTDRRKAAGLQKHEAYYIAHKHGLTPAKVKAIIKRVGNDRKKVYAECERIS